MQSYIPLFKSKVGNSTNNFVMFQNILFFVVNSACSKTASAKRLKKFIFPITAKGRLKCPRFNLLMNKICDVSVFNSFQ